MMGSRITYDQAYRDREALWNIGPANDMTGAYEDQGDLEKLLAKPSKVTARNCLIDQIDYWFTVGIDDGGKGGSKEARDRAINTDRGIADIAKRYGHWELITNEEFL
jgi:hypothetical protein